MATEKRQDLISRKDLIKAVESKIFAIGDNTHPYEAIRIQGKYFREVVDNAPKVDAVEVPCKIGDFVWAIRNFKGKKHPQRGVVSDMYFLNDMSLQIVVKYVARGKWGETVFATDKEAYAAIGERKDNG